MSSNAKDPGLYDIEVAKRDAEQARQRLASTSGALKARLKPSALANDAWSGVRDKSTELADEAVQAVKDRPLTASGVVAGLALFLARDSVWSTVRGLFRREDESLVTTNIGKADDNYDLAAPIVSRSINEGASA
jgi:ElaB/YqjD/DUF883 family membrane-anchored ribosome-binding protein